MIFLRKELVLNDLTKFSKEIASRFGLAIDIYKEEVSNHTIRLGYLLEMEGNKKTITREYAVNEQGELAVIHSEPWCVRIHSDEEASEEGNYKILGDAMEAAINEQYPAIISVWATKNKENNISTVVFYDTEKEARNMIGDKDIEGNEVVDVVKGYCIVGPDNMIVEGTENFFCEFEKAFEDLKMLKNHSKSLNQHSSKEKTAVAYDEQIYLLSYWLKANLINFEPTIENVKEQLFLEFGINDASVYQDVYELLNEQ